MDRQALFLLDMPSDTLLTIRWTTAGIIIYLGKCNPSNKFLICNHNKFNQGNRDKGQERERGGWTLHQTNIKFKEIVEILNFFSLQEL